MFHRVVDAYLDAYFNLPGLVAAPAAARAAEAAARAAATSSSAAATATPIIAGIPAPGGLSMPIPGASSVILPSITASGTPGASSGTPGASSGTGIGEEHLEKLKINEFAETFKNLEVSQISSINSILGELSENLGDIKDIELFEAFKKPKPEESLLKGIGKARVTGYRSIKVTPSKIDRNIEKIKREIQNNPILANKINETLSINANNILKKMKPFFDKAVNPTSYIDANAKNDVEDIRKWLLNTNNQDILLDKLEKTPEYNKDPLRFYKCLTWFKTEFGKSFKLSFNISSKIKTLKDDPFVKADANAKKAAEAAAKKAADDAAKKAADDAAKKAAAAGSP